MGLSSGTRLGPYQILESLGAGGMGEVYRARDTRLDRSVAVKIIHAELSQDPQRRSRFEREAKAIAAMSHPHICALYDVGHHEGVDFLVMELLEGKTLAARLESGPQEIGEVLIWAIQIADALDKSHQQGIVHRDLKPANVMIGRSGVKLLDFGLARFGSKGDTFGSGEGAEGAALMTALQTKAAPMTMDGTILGTIPYMAPEQLEGKEADARADIFALGVIIYEMVTGRRPFEGASPASVIGAILHTTAPPIKQLAPGVPPPLDRLVAICLSKSPEDRWSTAHDVLLQLKGISEVARADQAPVVERSRKRERLAWSAAAIAALAAVALAALIVSGRNRSTPADARLDVMSVLPPEQTNMERGEAPQISPDGRLIAFVATDRSGSVGLYVRRRDSMAASPLPGTEGASMPFWSPDGRMLAFFAQGQLKTIAIAGGSSHAIAPAPVPRGGAWGRDNMILFAGLPNRPPFLVPAAGGEARPVPVAGPVTGFRAFPAFLPDGRHYLYLTLSAVAHIGVGLHVASLDSTETVEVAQSMASAVYTPGFLLLRRDRALVAQPFDSRTLKLSGSPVPIADAVGFNAVSYQGLFSASDDGTLAYQALTAGSRYVWFDRQGTRLEAAVPAADYNTLCMTPDEKQIVYELADPTSGGIDLWAFDVVTARASRLTFDPAVDFIPVCSPTGPEVVFSSLRDGPPNLFRQLIANPGSEKSVLKSQLPKIASDWSVDGRLIVYAILNQKTSWDIEVLPLAGGQSQTFLATPAEERNARLSPDGRWMAYVSNETGSFEVYVQPYPATGTKWQISKGGGVQPQWRRDGRELFYVAPDKKLTGVAVRTGSDFAPGEARALFDTRMAGWDRSNTGTQYVVAADGQRFLVNTATDETLAITLVRNWSSPIAR